MEHNQDHFMRIDTQILARNAKTCIESVQVPVIAVVKMDGYGVGIIRAAEIWRSAGASMFAVSEPREALALRQAGFTEDILLMAPVAEADTLDRLLEAGIILTVTDPDNARFYLSRGQGGIVRAHAKVDVGMGRFGDYNCAGLMEIYEMEGLQVEGIYAHFSKSFEKKYKVTGRQLEDFLGIVGRLEKDGYKPGIRHIANSCAALRFPQTRLDAVRLGSALVGALLAPAPVKLELAHNICARVVAVKELCKGDTLGYAACCKAKKDTTAVVVALGFYYGYGMTAAPDPFPARDFGVYLYHLWQRWRNPPVLYWQGTPLKLVGRVGSQYTLFDATDVVGIAPGDLVTGRMNLLQYTGRREYV